MEGGVAPPRAGDPPRPPPAVAEERRPPLHITMPTPSLPGMQSAPPKAPMMRPIQPGDGTPSPGVPFWFSPGSFPLTASASSDAIGKLNSGMLGEPKLVSSIPLLPRPPMSGEAPPPHEDFIRMTAPAQPVNNQFAMIEPGSAIFHFPSHRLLNCNSRFHRLLEEMGCPMRMGIHWQDLLNSPPMKDVNSGTQGRIEKFAEQCVAPKQRHGGPPPQQFTIQAKSTGSTPPRNFFLTIVPLQQHGADWALAMWILENVNEPLTPLSGPAPLSAPAQARPPSHAVAAPAPASAPSSAPQEHAKRTDPRKSTEELQVLADKAERKRKEKPWVAATMKWNMKVKKGGKPE